MSKIHKQELRRWKWRVTIFSSKSIDNYKTTFRSLQRCSLHTLRYLTDHLNQQQGEGGETKSMTFKQLLDPRTCTNVMAAQGLHHVLLLATRNVLSIFQPEHFGQINLALSNGL